MSIETWIKIWRAGFVVAFLGATQFLVCCVFAMILYPGGTVAEPTSDGYDLSENHLSELGREVSLSAEDNSTGSSIFNTSLILLGLTSLAFFGFMPTHAYDKVKGLSFAAVIGAGASVSLIVMGMNPCDLSPLAHYLALFFWIVTIFFSSSIHALCMLTSKEDIAMWMSLISVAVAMFSVAYIYHGTETAAAVMLKREIPMKSALLQKLLFIATLIWMFSVSAKLLLTADFSEFYSRDVSKETDEYLKELEDQPWTPTRK